MTKLTIGVVCPSFALDEVWFVDLPVRFKDPPQQDTAEEASHFPVANVLSNLDAATKESFSRQWLALDKGDISDEKPCAVRNSFEPCS